MEQDWTIFTRNYFAIFFTAFGFFSSLYILLSPISLYTAELGVNEAVIGLIIGIFTVTAVIARIFAGPYANRWPKRLLGISLTIFFLSPLLYIVSGSSSELFTIRAFHGAGMIFSISVMTLLAKMTPKSRLGQTMGVYGGFMGAAQVSGFFLSGILLEKVGFTGIFYIATGFALFGGVSGIFISNNWNTQPESIPMLRSYRLALRDKNTQLASIGVLLWTFGYGVLLTFGPLYLKDLGLPTSLIGVFFTLTAIGSMVARPIAGRLSDTKGRMPVILPSMFIIGISLYAFSTFVTTNALFLIAILYGIGIGSAYVVQSALVIDTIDIQNKGSALAVLTACFDLGYSFGSIGIGLIAGSFKIGYSLLFQVTSAISLLGIGFYAYLSRR